ncbi:MAG: LytTR family DNA-binding domain-containing protein [Paraglaciecola sp.]|uniref:LytTR family DNA-binding domain-containing protein n=1 Tax=Paraglaciecola sp. TaxID=1920173 RepID=UPI003296A411
MANREINNNNQSVTAYSWGRSVLYRLLLVAIIGVCIGLLAPFGMHYLPMHISIIYWVSTCLVGYLVYQPIIVLFDKLLEKVLSKSWYRIAIATCVASVLMSLVTIIINWMFFDDPINVSKQFMFTFPKCLLIGGIITFITMIREHNLEQKQKLIESKQELEEKLQASDVLINKAHEDFMKGIPIEKRGKLLCLEMSDHYVKVHTDKGHHMMLMRFKDAIQNLESYPGLQTHRSWWVAKDAVIKVEKVNRKQQLILINELVIPVSRTYQSYLSETGFGL